MQPGPLSVIPLRADAVILIEHFKYNPLIRSFGALAIAEMVNRGTRILAAIALAHVLGPAGFGAAAIAITTADVLRVLTQTGLGARVVQVAEAELEAVCTSAFRLNWMLSGSIATLQIALAFPVAAAFGEPQISWMLIGLAIPLVTYPIGAVSVWRVHRANRMGLASVMLAVSVAIENLLTIVFALTGFGVWSVVLPRIVTAIVWVVCYCCAEPWRPSEKADSGTMRKTLRFGRIVLGSELTTAFAQHGDKYLIGSLLGLEALGIWYFAINIGLGISKSFAHTLSYALLPFFSSADDGQDRRRRFKKSLMLSYGTLIPVLVAQVGLAPVYVPLLFGEQWVHATELIMILCLSAVTIPLWRATGQYLRAADRPGVELKWTFVQAFAGLAAIGCAAPFGLHVTAFAVLGVNIALIPAALIAVNRLSPDYSPDAAAIPPIPLPTP